MAADSSAFFLIISAGVMQGSFVLPMKYTRKWEWENTWLAFCFLGFIVLPLALALLTVPHLSLVLASVSFRSILLAALFGFGWGWGSVCFGLGINALGVGLGYSIILGLTGSLGSLIPWITMPAKTLSYSILLWCGILIMLAGVVVSSIAGRERDRRSSFQDASRKRCRFLTGLAICITSGVLSCFMNLGFTYGADITRRAESLGATAATAPNVLWLVIMGAGFVANGIYCGYLLITKGSWRKYLIQGSRSHWEYSLGMGVLWVGSLVAYGIGANRLGSRGPSIGWPILMSLCIVTSNLWGLRTGEWRGTGTKTSTVMVLGLVILLLAVSILGYASARA